MLNDTFQVQVPVGLACELQEDMATDKQNIRCAEFAWSSDVNTRPLILFSIIPVTIRPPQVSTYPAASFLTSYFRYPFFWKY